MVISLNLLEITANLISMTQKNNNWLNYLLVFALMLLPLQNGWAAVNSIASAPAEVKSVCHEMAKTGSDHSQHQSQQMDMQQHSAGCCDKDMNCQQQCADCLHCPSVSVILNYFQKLANSGFQDLYIESIQFPNTTLASLQFRPPRV